MSIHSLNFNSQTGDPLAADDPRQGAGRCLAVLYAAQPLVKHMQESRAKGQVTKGLADSQMLLLSTIEHFAGTLQQDIVDLCKLLGVKLEVVVMQEGSNASH